MRAVIEYYEHVATPAILFSQAEAPANLGFQCGFTYADGHNEWSKAYIKLHTRKPRTDAERFACEQMLITYKDRQNKIETGLHLTSILKGGKQAELDAITTQYPSNGQARKE